MKKYAFLMSICLGIPMMLCAQYTSNNGQFEVDQIKGCAPLTITISVIPPFQCDSSNPCAAFYDFANNPTVSEPLITPPFVHTYTQPGIYTLHILMGVQADDIQIEVTPNVPPQFDVYTCAGDAVSVNITDTAYDGYIIDFNDATVITAESGDTQNHTYATPGNKTVSVRGVNDDAADNCNAAVKNVMAMATLPTPTIDSIRVVDASTIKLAYTTLPTIHYKLEFGINTGTPAQTFDARVYNTTIDTIFTLNPDERYFCFRLAAFDHCANAITSYSNIICTSDLDLEVVNNAINVTWQTSTTVPAFVNFSLRKEEYSDPVLSFSTPYNTTSVSDTDVDCGILYCYTVTTIYSNGSTSKSMRKCETAISSDIPTPVENLTAMVEPADMVLEWEPVTDFIPAEFTVRKSIQGNYSELTKTTSLQIHDVTYLTQQQSCYIVSYTDACGNLSPPSIEACPIRLAGSLDNANNINITWSAYTGWAHGVSSYEYEKYSVDGELLDARNMGTGLSFFDDEEDPQNQTLIYVIRANAVEPGLPQAVSNEIRVIKDPNLFYPTAFTPNGDGLNDVFNVIGQFVVDFEMDIFNRWGELMFTTSDFERGWDGNFRGNAMPEGTYTFVAHITDNAGRTFKKSGSVLLIKKNN